MFHVDFGNVVIRTVSAEKRGLCLEATNKLGERILMDFCGMNPALVPDGTNAYLFGNTVIFVTRWSNMTAREKRDVETGTLGFVVHPYEYVQLSLQINSGWNDVGVNLHHCYDGLNDENAPVEKAIFIFADTHDEDYIISREVMLPPFLQKYLQKCNVSCHQSLALDSMRSSLELQAKTDPGKDFYDYLYDLIWSKTKDTQRRARQAEPEDVPDGIYVKISSDDEITDIYQNEAASQKPSMSAEVKLYLQLAESGLDEGQYNLGVCYETGDGVEQDYKQAVYWYKKAADQGHDKAQHNLGLCFFNGFGVAPDYKEAARLFLLSAQQGNMYAQYNMGVCCYMGHGVEQNVIRAVEWFQKAAAQGHPDAKRVLQGG